MEQTNTFSPHRAICPGYNTIQALIDQIGIEVSLEDEAEMPPGVWEMLIQKYTPMLNSYAYRFLGTDEMAQDIVQETWIALYLQIRRQSLSWAIEASIAAWLRTVVKNKALNYKKMRDRMSSLDMQTTMYEPHAASFDYPVEVVMREDLHRALYQAIQALQEPQREVIAYRFFYDCSLCEIVQALDVPLNTVKDRLARAKKKLQRLLSDDGIDWCDLEAVA